MTAIKPGAAAAAIDRRDPAIRLFLFHGEDESASRAFAQRLAATMGTDAERIDLTGPELKTDAARLADEAASISLFGGPRFIRIDPAGDEIADAVAALLSAGAAGNPAVAVAGKLRKDSKLLKLAEASPLALASASYNASAADFDRLAQETARTAGLELTPDVARRIAHAAAADRAVLASEVEKLALYLDAAPDRRREAGHDDLDALLADASEGSLAILVDAALDGRADAANAELTRLAADGVVGVPVVLAFERRLVLLSTLRAEVDGGNAIARVMEGSGRAIFWKDRDIVARQLRRWTGPALAAAGSRMLAAKRAAMRAAGAGAAGVEADVLALARYAGKLGR